MSLIQEALEKAGRMSHGVELKPVPVEEKPVLLQEAKVEKIPALKTEPFWLVDFKIKLLGIFDKMRITSGRPGESRKTGFIATALALLFLGAVFYVHTMAVRPPEEGTIPPALLGREILPFSLENVSEGFPADFELTGITFSGNTRLALINNQVVGVGETLKEKATVLEIQGQKVVLDFQGKRIDLEL